MPVRVFIVKCTTCGKIYSVYPSFVLEGTTLTLPALLFISFAYETSDLTWREIPEKFCTPTDKIAHSTPYKAVHGIGKSVQVNEAIVQERIRNLKTAYLEQPVSDPAIQLHQKSLFEHTQEREKFIQILIYPLSQLCRTVTPFIRIFYLYLQWLEVICSGLDPPVVRLYKQ